jgi:hypothetical protein
MSLACWLKPVIPATQEAKIRRMMVREKLWKKWETPSEKETKSKKGCGRGPAKCEALSSNPVPHTHKKESP